jgi:hypothetical protein
MKRGTNGEGEEMNDRKPVGKPVANMHQEVMQKGKGSGTLTPDILEKLGKQLQGYYDGLIEPIPDRFAKILGQFDKPGDKFKKPGDKDPSE